MKRTILYFGVVISILLLPGCSGKWQSPYTFEKETSKQCTTKKETPKKKYIHPCSTHTGGCVW